VLILKNIGMDACLYGYSENVSSEVNNGILECDRGMVGEISEGVVGMRFRAGGGGEVAIYNFTGAVKGICESSSTQVVVTEFVSE